MTSFKNHSKVNSCDPMSMFGETILNIITYKT